MKVMTFNTQHCRNYITGKIDFDAMARAIARCDADVVGLNEMRGTGPDPEYTAQVAQLAALTGMPYCYFAPAIQLPNGPYGNGILSRIPIIKAETVPIPDPAARKENGYYETRCILKARLAGGITVLVTHMGLNTDEEENAVCAVMEQLVKEKCILMGDFNMRPENPLLRPIQEAMRDVAACMATPKCSFPSDLPTCKIDYIFVSEDIQVPDADIPAIVASDHRPHTATLAL